MKIFKLTIVATSVILASGISAAYAEVDNQQLQAMIEKIVNQRTAKLQQQVSQLQHQVVTLKTELRNQPGSNESVSYQKSAKKRRGARKGGATAVPATTVVVPATVPAATTPATLPGSYTTYFGGVPVITSPFIGQRSAFDGSDLVVNLSSVNLDTRLLKQAQAINIALGQQHVERPDHPVIELSGELEGIGDVVNYHPGSTQGDIDLTTAEIDVFAQINKWILGYISFDYDNSPSTLTPYRVANSRVFVNKAFMTFGNLQVTPFYASLGQLYVPFGQYGSYMISSPVTQLLGRTKERSFVLGMTPQGDTGIYAAGYVFRGDTSGDNGSNGGVNLGFKGVHGNWSVDLAAGMIVNIADSQGFQGSVFGLSADAEEIQHGVPGFDAHGSISYKDFTLMGEYTAATQEFAPIDLSFNGEGARPESWYVEGVYSFTCHDKPGSFAIGAGFTRDALGLMLPEQRYLATLNYSFWRDTLASLEFRHDVNYSSNTTASGKDFFIATPPWRDSNMVTAQFALFF